MATKTKPTQHGIKTAAKVSLNFSLKNQTLSGYCKANGIDKGMASRALRGIDTYPAAIELKQRLIAASREPAKPEQSMPA